jgi:hypothetical protein
MIDLKALISYSIVQINIVAFSYKVRMKFEKINTPMQAGNFSSSLIYNC